MFNSSTCCSKMPLLRAKIGTADAQVPTVTPGPITNPADTLGAKSCLNPCSMPLWSCESSSPQLTLGAFQRRSSISICEDNSSTAAHSLHLHSPDFHPPRPCWPGALHDAPVNLRLRFCGRCASHGHNVGASQCPQTDQHRALLQPQARGCWHRSSGN